MLRAFTKQADPRTRRSDAELLAQIALDQNEALGQLYDRHAASLLAFLQRIAPPGEAEDLLQLAFLRAAELAASFDPKAASARPWLFAIASRLLQGRRRALARFAAALGNLARWQRTSQQHSPEVARDLDRALQQLTESKRSVFLLSEVEGFTADQVASILDIPVGTVWTRLHHARRELRAFFGEGET